MVKCCFLFVRIFCVFFFLGSAPCACAGGFLWAVRVVDVSRLDGDGARPGHIDKAGDRVDPLSLKSTKTVGPVEVDNIKNLSVNDVSIC